MLQTSLFPHESVSFIIFVYKIGHSEMCFHKYFLRYMQYLLSKKHNAPFKSIPRISTNDSITFRSYRKYIWNCLMSATIAKNEFSLYTNN